MELIPNTHHNHTYTFPNDSADVINHPALQEVPQTLQARDKHDVCLIKGMRPVVITPKSDYRPCQAQYPLKREAAEGITPVFNSLWKAGVIVPCETSLVRTHASHACKRISCTQKK